MFNLMKKFDNYFILLITISLLIGHTSFSAKKDETEALREFAAKKKRPNPHNDIDCVDCHKTKPKKNDTRHTVTFNLPIKQMCIECHEEAANIHPTGIVPSMKVPDSLPLDNKKEVTCVTCHDMHAENTKYSLLRGFESGKYKWRTDLCYDCHGMAFLKKNPHRVQDGKRKCTYCHAERPKVTDTEKTVKFRINILTLCNFCHNKSARNHPMNVDTTVSPPASLPRDAEGNITCATCHDPHGASATAHYLRPDYIYKIEEGKYVKPHASDSLCLVCHLTRPPEGATADEVDFRFGGNFTILCNSCHGTEANMHPVDIIPPPDMKVWEKLPLRDGKVTCVTCHNTGLSNRSSIYLLRGFEEGGPNKEINDLCFRCHSREDFKKNNPHFEQKAKRKCMNCHIVPPDREGEGRGSIKIQRLKMLCIRCHSHRPHPASFSHVVKPTMIVPKNFPLDVNGEITCITCHNPHLEGEKAIKNKRLRKGFACNLCHLV